ncbi:TPA: hypothetical protein KL437_001267 [Escherichia coli]|nr:hypothetical protein [Escherichia coli]HDV6797517.1 hypothetical protein [Escherichia coli]HDV6883514.1 hypothetical protein [Escherichia coli]
MTTITKERIELFIKNPLENGLTRGEQMELARIALASLEADPVKRVNSDQMRRVCLEANRHLDKYDAMAKEVNKLLGRIAPPAPVVPDEIEPDDGNTFDYVDGWNACRAAMLHGAEPVSQTYKLNELAGNYPVTPDGWVMVPKEPTQAMIKAWLSEIANFRGHAAGYRAALEAAPQLEVNRG